MKYSYQILASDLCSDGFLKLHRHRLQHASFRGGDCEPIVRERLEGLSAVSVLLYDPLQDVVVLVEQFRVGLMGVLDPPWCLETVSGFCDCHGEAPEAVARREVVEETGCELLDLVPIGDFFTSPGISVEQFSLYLGRVNAPEPGGVFGLDHEGEEMRVAVLPREDAVTELFGRMNSTSIIITLQWLEGHREALLQRWGISPGG